MNDALVRFQALALQAVANDLHTSLNSLSNPKTDKEKKRLVGYPISMIVLRAFAVELTLKTMVFRRTGKYKRTHDLSELYDDLDTDTQAIISKIENSHGIAPLRRILEKHKNDFVDWRYLKDMHVDGGKMHADFLDIARALDVLLLVSEGKDFLAICDR